MDGVLPRPRTVPSAFSLPVRPSTKQERVLTFDPVLPVPAVRSGHSGSMWDCTVGATARRVGVRRKRRPDSCTRSVPTRAPRTTTPTGAGLGRTRPGVAAVPRRRDRAGRRRSRPYLPVGDQAGNGDAHPRHRTLFLVLAWAVLADDSIPDPCCSTSSLPCIGSPVERPSL